MHHGPNGQGSVEPVTSSTPTQREIKSVTITGSLEQRGARHVRHIHSAPAPNGPSTTTPSPATARTDRKPWTHASDEGGQDLGGARNVRLRRSTANCGSMQAPLASVASAAAATAFTKTMGSRPKSTKPTRFAAASCKADSRSTRTAATITRSQLSSN